MVKKTRERKEQGEVSILGGLFKKTILPYKKNYYFCGVKVWSKQSSPLQIARGEIEKLHLSETVQRIDQHLQQHDSSLAAMEQKFHTQLLQMEETFTSTLAKQADLLQQSIASLAENISSQQAAADDFNKRLAILFQRAEESADQFKKLVSTDEELSFQLCEVQKSSNATTLNLKEIEKDIGKQIQNIQSETLRLEKSLRKELETVTEQGISQSFALANDIKKASATFDDQCRSLSATDDKLASQMLNLQKNFGQMQHSMAVVDDKLSLVNQFVKTTDIIQFSNSDLPLMKRGFYGVENWGCWLQKHAFLLLKTISLAQDITIDIRLNCYHPETAKTISVYANGRHVGDYSSAQATNHLQINIDKYTIPTNGFINLEFVTDILEAPSEIEGSTDARLLGFGLIDLHANIEFVCFGFDSDLFKALWSQKHQCTFNNDEWEEYFATHDIEKETAELKKNMLEDGKKLIDEFIARRREPYYFSDYENKQHRKVLQQSIAEYQIADTTGFQPEIFYFKNGLSFLDEKIIKAHLNGRDVVDGGACSGDSTLMFAQYDFVHKVYAFEPVKQSFDNMQKTLEINHCSKAEAVNAGLSDSDANAQIMGELCRTVSIDSFAIDKKIGCIKLDVEGMETKVISGAIQTIKRDKPLLLICLYHSPRDFFGIKKTIEALDLGYKFMVQDTEPCNAAVGIHLMLIAYQ